MFDQFVHLVAQASTWAYVVLTAFALLDAVLPVVPSETAVITAGVVAAAGDLSLPLVLGTAAAGAFLGDNGGYLIGHRYGERARRRFLDGERAARWVRWAQQQLVRRGGELILVARFIPGGRTAVTLTAGTTRFPWPKFARADAVAAVLWSAYAGLLGFLGGKAFEHHPWRGLLVALGAALLVALVVEVGRWWLRQRTGGDRTKASGRSGAHRRR